jgi:hypothetical protein
VTVLMVLAALALGLVVVDRLLVWCELRGWITWRLTPRPTRSFRGAAGNALLNLDALFQPQTRHVVEMRIDQQVHREADDQGGDGLPRRPL